ncbi:MAG: 4Fe-4S binding protein, partial [Coriobacteriia bacterium]|nr:4Fe-4S binding protein [Coriobacteriia bacterium]
VGDVQSSPFAGNPRAVVDAALCTACGLCAEVCRFAAISATSFGPPVFDPLSCEGCGRCANLCPADAIAMHPGVAGEACLGTSDIGTVSFGRLEPGEDLSGKLVTEVRRLGAEAAAAAGADVMLIDGPPGIGCPLIAAVTGSDLVVAVTEPTISGAHDLSRLLEVTGRFELPVLVVLNKADLSASGAVRIRDLCSSSGLQLVAEVPFDRMLADIASDPGQHRLRVTPGGQALSSAWECVETTLGLS